MEMGREKERDRKARERRKEERRRERRKKDNEKIKTKQFQYVLISLLLFRYGKANRSGNDCH